MNNRFIIRRADITDIEALSQLCQQTFRETFIEDFSISCPEKDINPFIQFYSSPESFAKRIHNTKEAIWVVEDKTNRELIAYTMGGPCHVDDIPHPDVCSNTDGIINRLYIRRDLRNNGFGQQLMNIILSWLEEQYPKRPIWLCVWSKNLKAQKFYEHYGFKKVGEFDYPIGEWKDCEFIMKRQTDT